MTESLFPEQAPPEPTSRRAPENLNPGEMREIERWAEEKCPWISRGAFDSFTSIEEYVEQCLDWFRGKRTMRPSWVGTVKNWIRKDERSRLERMARSGNESARLALRDPAAWARGFDRSARIGKEIESSAPAELIAPRKDVGRSASLTHRA